jgi:Ca2+-binding RTX toxin-like protein
MAVIIGGTEDFPGKNNCLGGTGGDDFVFGDPYTTGAYTFVDSEEGDFEIDIEPQIGGALSSGRGGNDRIDGRGGLDQIYGDAWEITGTAKGGNDRLVGDQIFGDADVMSGHVRGGNDRLHSHGVSHLHGVGDAYEMYGHARGGNDRLSGDGNFNGYGDAQQMREHSRGGDDRLYGSTGNNKLIGDSFSMKHEARGGNDWLHGGAGADRLVGDADIMSGDSRGGNDRLIGGKGNDTLFGDFDLPLSIDFGFHDTSNVVHGADTFIFTPGSGLDVIGDFQSGKDKIDLSDYGFTEFADLTIETRAGGEEPVTIIDLDKRAANINEITLQDITSLQVSDFVFT